MALFYVHRQFPLDALSTLDSLNLTYICVQVPMLPLIHGVAVQLGFYLFLSFFLRRTGRDSLVAESKDRCLTLTSVLRLPEVTCCFVSHYGE